MSNFSYLATKSEYSLFANSAIEAEKVFSTSPAMCAVGCRKALKLAVREIAKRSNKRQSFQNQVSKKIKCRNMSCLV